MKTKTCILGDVVIVALLSLYPISDKDISAQVNPEIPEKSEQIVALCPQSNDSVMLDTTSSVICSFKEWNNKTGGQPVGLFSVICRY